MDFSAIQEEIHGQAREQLDRLCEGIGVPESHRHLVTGRPEAEIPTQAKMTGAKVLTYGMP